VFRLKKVRPPTSWMLSGRDSCLSVFVQTFRIFLCETWCLADSRRSNSINLLLCGTVFWANYCAMSWSPEKVSNLVLTDVAISSLSKSLRDIKCFRKQQVDQPDDDFCINVPEPLFCSTKAGNELIQICKIVPTLPEVGMFCDVGLQVWLDSKCTEVLKHKQVIDSMT